MKMNRYSLFLFWTIALFAEDMRWEYSYGLHDFMVEDKIHTLGINAGIYVAYQSDEYTFHTSYFEIFTEYDEQEQDPDHIPIWFRANYNFKTMLFEQNNTFILNAIANFDWKMNTVSSIEQYLKSGAGIECVFHENGVEIIPKIVFGSYYIEIDDDIPKLSDFNRDDLSIGYQSTVMYGLGMSWDMSPTLSLGLELEEWNEKGKWLERNMELSLSYKKIKSFHIVFSTEKTIYNLDNFAKEGIDILPWNHDTLFKLVVKLPLNWEW